MTKQSRGARRLFSVRHGIAASRLRALLAHSAHGPAIRDDLRSGLPTLPIWMQEFLRDLVGSPAQPNDAQPDDVPR